MTNYPNRKALNDALDIYYVPMRTFIINCLQKVKGRKVEDLIYHSLASNQQVEFKRKKNIEGIKTAIDLNYFAPIIRKNWRNIFEREFGKRTKNDVRSAIGLISEARNRSAHRDGADITSEDTRVYLFHIAKVLGYINASDGNQKKIEDIRNQLFADNAHEHVADVSDQLETTSSENANLEKLLKGKSEIQERRKKFWKNLCDYAAQADTLVKFQKPGSANYLNVSKTLIWYTGFNIVVWLGSQNREIAVRLYMSRQNFYLLEKQREEIDKEFGEPLEWEELPQRKRKESRVVLRKDITNPIDEADWQNQHKWIVSKIEKFYEKFNAVFLPRLQEPIG